MAAELAAPGIDPDDLNGAFAAYLDPLAIPEPTSAALGLSPLACLAATRRRIR